MTKRLAALLLLAGTTLGACGGGEDVVAKAGGAVEPLEVALPGELVGLKVEQEKVDDALENFRPSYVDSAALFSFRGDKDIVQATLQVARFRDEERNRSSQFRNSIIAQFGSTRPRATKMGDVTIFRTTQTKQTVATWFDGLDWYLLSIRDDFDRPRTLMRETLEVTTT
jgi:hypothetical protein